MPKRLSVYVNFEQMTKESLKKLSDMKKKTGVGAIVFDGRVFAKDKEKVLKKKVAALKKKGITPQLSVILTTNDKASVMYVNMKKKKAEELGIIVEVYKATAPQRNYQYVLNLISAFNRDPNVHGIMVQLPLGFRYIPYRTKILEAILPEKDVDGLRKESPFLPATVKAIIEIITEARKKVLLVNPPLVFVVGSKGVVGSGLIKALNKLGGYKTRGFDVKTTQDWRSPWGIPPFISLKADIIVTATGVSGVIQGKHVNPGSVVIDVGSPYPDIRFWEVNEKASFMTPVPGGVGPVTIMSLLENLVEAAYNSSNTHLEGKLS